jgi:hypothetical protein
VPERWPGGRFRRIRTSAGAKFARKPKCGLAAPAAGRKTPALAEQARAFAAPDGLKGLRDRALLLVGFAGAFCRSEPVALDVADVEETEDGSCVTSNAGPHGAA